MSLKKGSIMDWLAGPSEKNKSVKRSGKMKGNQIVPKTVSHRTHKIMSMALLPPYDSGSSSSEDEENFVVKPASNSRNSCVLVEIPTDDLEANLNDIQEDIENDRDIFLPLAESPNFSFLDEDIIFDNMQNNFELETFNLESPNVAVIPTLVEKKSSDGQIFTSNLEVKQTILRGRKLKFKGAKKSKPREYSWKKERFNYVVTNIEKDSSKESSQRDSIRTPLQYFSDFFSSDIWDLITEETIRYSINKRATPLEVNKNDIQNFIGIEIAMGIIKMPAYTDYWSDDCRYDKIANVMSLKKYQSIRRHIHFVDNSKEDSDRYFKIRPILNIIRRNCLSVDEEGHYSIDEMMVPYKGTRAGSRRQYIKNKPHKWGFKIFVRAGISGMVYDFLLYGGNDTFTNLPFTNAEERLGLGGKTVIALSNSIINKPGSFVFFDNFFSSLELLILLRQKYGILAMGTIRENRLRGCPLLGDKILAKKGRGSYDIRSCNTNKVCVVKWYDNKCVCLASTFCEVQPLGTIKRFENKKSGKPRLDCNNNSEAAKGSITARSKINVPCPDIVKQYNAFMGGVDLADMLVALYRTGMRSHRWYLAIFSQLIDVCISNAWLLYRRDCNKNNCKNYTLKKFRWDVAEKLMRKGKKYSANTDKLKRTKRPTKLTFNQDEDRFDKNSHFPQTCEKGRCRNCSGGQTRIECIKCNARLCLTKERNCFFEFHHKN